MPLNSSFTFKTDMCARLTVVAGLLEELSFGLTLAALGL